MTGLRVRFLGTMRFGIVVKCGLAQGPVGAPYEAVQVRWDDGSLNWAASSSVAVVSRA